MMSKQIDESKIDLILRVDDIPPKQFETILPNCYMPQDIAHAADLIEKMLEWVPNNRISCEEALKHPFFK